MEFKSLKEIFQYLMNGYKYELQTVTTKRGTQKRLENEELESIIDTQLQERIKIEDLYMKVKLGPAYNRKEIPWIQIFSLENRKGTTGRYIGISFNAEEQIVESWIGFGRAGKKQSQILVEAKEYISKYMLIESDLKCGYQYNDNPKDAFIIKKQVQLKEMKDEEFLEDLYYLSDLYKSYERKYELAVFKENTEKQKTNINEKTNINKYDLARMNQTMLSLVEEMGRLAKEIQELNSKI